MESTAHKNNNIRYLISIKKLKSVAEIFNYITRISRNEVYNFITKNLYLTDDKYYKYFSSVCKKEVLNEKYKDDRALKNANIIYDMLKKNNITSVNSLLDIGCNDGIITEKMSKLLNTTDAQCLEIGNFFNSRKSNVKLTVTDGKTIDIKQKFNMIIALHSLHHFQHFDMMMKEIDRISEKGTIFFIKEHDCYSKEVQNILDIYHCVYEMVVTDHPEFAKTYYAKYYTIKGLADQLRKYNFELVDFKYTGGVIRNYYSIYIKK